MLYRLLFFCFDLSKIIRSLVWLISQGLRSLHTDNVISDSPCVHGTDLGFYFSQVMFSLLCSWDTTNLLVYLGCWSLSLHFKVSTALCTCIYLKSSIQAFFLGSGAWTLLPGSCQNQFQFLRPTSGCNKSISCLGLRFCLAL